jgi:phosphatidate cytidylyltransferase
MKVRIISAAIGLAILAVIMVLGGTAVGILVFALSLIGLHEFYGAVEKGGYKPVKLVGYLSSLPLLAAAFIKSAPSELMSSKGSFVEIIALWAFLLLVALLCMVIFSNGACKPVDAAFTAFGVFYVVFLFSFVTLTINLEFGSLYIWFIVIGAFATDTAAYFTGVTMGKTKILPAVSPKKSLEGSIGGIIGCVAAMAIYGYFVMKHTGPIPLYHFIILGLLCGIISQIGDWAASAIKRSAGIKDYGRLMPGHGGVLDRCDSILFTAPVVYFYITMLF